MADWFADGDYREVLLYACDFTDGLNGWTVEGAAEAAAVGGRLMVDATESETPGATVWCDEMFAGNIRFVYDACILPPVSRDNMNVFFFFQEGETPEAELAERVKTADYGLYHEHRTYIATYVSENGGIRARMRKCPGFNLVCESHPEGALEALVPYRFEIIHCDGRFSFRVDGIEVLQYTDMDGSQAAGLFGFRTWNTKMWWSNFRAYRLEQVTG